MNYKLVGLISVLENPVGFLIPIFEYNNQYWLQDIDSKGYIQSFIKVQIPDTMYIVNEKLYIKKVSEIAIYVFAFNKNDIIIESKFILREKILQKINLLSEYPFIKKGVLEFFKIETDYFETVKLASNELTHFNKAISKKWLDSNCYPLFINLSLANF